MRLLRRGVISLRGAIPAPSEREVLRALGIPRAERFAEVAERGVRDAIGLGLGRALGMATFEGLFRTAAVTGVESDRVLVEGASPDFLRSTALGRRFAGVTEIVLLVVTLGEPWDDALDCLGRRGEAAEAWFLDAIGKLFVDRAARLVEVRASGDLARAGLGRVGRYRPGYGDLPLEAQAELCRLCEAHRIGVRPNEAMSLWPRKSVTGLVGFRPGDDEAPPSSSTREIQAKESA
jgi:hypothetical protein